ncbi:Wzz/FepE/Etk N-terminal domain-containing protein [uncultured Devosia sp.]|uniref:GumC family protein n=1 Tax=uncultured Devosia sp. TaxID=211434 RepID=UPI0035CA2193
MAYESQALRDARIDLGAVCGAVVRRLPRIIVVTLLLLAATFVLLMFVPRMYESSAGILVEPRNNLYTGSGNEQPSSVSGLAAGVVSSQIELIKSRETLLNVIDQLDLRSVPEFNGTGAGPSPLGIVSQFLGRKAAPANVDETVLANLLDRMTVIQERDSAIITVLVRSTNAELAAKIANGVANAHVVRRAGLSLSDTAEASGWLGDEIAKLRVSVTEAENAVADFKVRNDLFVGANNTSLADQDLSSVASQITEAQERKSAALSRASLIRGLLERGAPIDGIADVRASAVIQQLTQQKAQLQGEQAQKAATLLPNHPTILALVAQINELNNQINLEGRRVAEGLESEAEIEAGLETSLRAELTRAKGSASAATTNTVTLDGLEREAKAQRDLLESYLQRYSEASSRADSSSALPDVRVISLAAASVSPASPKTSLILMAVGIVAAAGQIGLVVLGELMSGRAILEGRSAPVQPERPQDELETAPFMEDELEPDQRWEAEPGLPPIAVAQSIEPTFSEQVTASEPEAEDDIVASDDLDWQETAPPVIIDPPIAEADQAERFAPLSHATAASDVIPADWPLADEPDDAEIEAVTPPTILAPRPAYTAFADLSADLALGRTRLVLLAGHRSNAACEVLAEALVTDALDKGLSVALVDAGSARLSDDPGLSDLSVEKASFGDVVHKSSDNTFAEVPWGQQSAIDHRSARPVTLVEALGDIYEVVVLMTGHVGMASTLPLFAELDGRLVLVASDNDDFKAVEDMRTHLSEAGFGRAEIVTTPELVAA